MLQSTDANNLTDLVKILMQVDTNLNQQGDKDIIVGLGNTGCGKSTMLTSLVYGKEALVNKEMEISAGRRTKKMKVI